MLFAFLFISILNLTLWKKIPLFAYLANIVICIGGVSYFILWAPLMGIHDYYYSALLVLFLCILVPFIWFIKSNYPNIFQGYILKSFVGVFLIFNFLYCFSVMKLKTGAEGKGSYVMVGNHDFVELMTWTNWDLRTNWYRYAEMKPYIKTIGIEKEDRVICIPDQSFNATLYMLDQKGWTNFKDYSKTEEIEELIQKGAKYLFIGNPEYLEKEFLAPYLTNQVGEFKGIKVFKL